MAALFCHTLSVLVSVWSLDVLHLVVKSTDLLRQTSKMNAHQHVCWGNRRAVLNNAVHLLTFSCDSERGRFGLLGDAWWGRGQMGHFQLTTMTERHSLDFCWFKEESAERRRVSTWSTVHGCRLMLRILSSSPLWLYFVWFVSIVSRLSCSGRCLKSIIKI